MKNYIFLLLLNLFIPDLGLSIANDNIYSNNIPKFGLSQDQERIYFTRRKYIATIYPNKTITFYKPIVSNKTIKLISPITPITPNKFFKPNKQVQNFKFYKNPNTNFVNSNFNRIPEQTIWRPFYYMPKKVPMNYPSMNFPRQPLPMHNNYLGNERFIPPYQNYPLIVNPNDKAFVPDVQIMKNDYMPMRPINHESLNNEIYNKKRTTVDKDNYGSVIIDNSQIEKENPSLDQKISDKLILNNSYNNSVHEFNSESHFIENNYSNNDFPIIIDNQNDKNLFEANQKMNDPTTSKPELKSQDGPKLFIKHLRQVMLTNESYTSEMPTSKPKLDEKNNLAGHSSKISDSYPQQFSPTHFKNTFEQMKAQKIYDQQKNPSTYGYNKPDDSYHQNTTDKNVITSSLSSSNVDSQTMSAPSTYLSNNNSPFNSFNNPHIMKRLQQQQQQQQNLQNALLARLGNQNSNQLESYKRHISYAQEKSIKERLLQTDNPLLYSNASPTMDASKNPNEFLTRRTNTYRYVIVTIIMAAIFAASVGIATMYFKQQKLSRSNSNINVKPSISFHDIKRFYQRQNTNSCSSISDSYGPNYCNRPVTTSVETGSTNTLQTKAKVLETSSLRQANTSMHR